MLWIRKVSYLTGILTLLSLAAPALAHYVSGVEAFNNGNYVTAMKEWKPLAERGMVDAQFNVGRMYHYGKGVTRNYKTAARWYQLAAEQGHVGSQYNLASMYQDGKGVTRDYKAAVRWFNLAAEKGDAYAQSNLGSMYEKGFGVVKDNRRAHMWLNISALHGNKNALVNRNMLELNMNPADITKANELARECVAKNYKDCEELHLH